MRGFAAVGLVDPRDSANVGGVIRAARCYGASFVATQGRLNNVKHNASVKGYRHIPVLRVDDIFSTVPYGADTVAVEYLSWAIPLPEFKHPSQAFYVFGPENGALPDETVARCDWIVLVPTAYCMNLAATVNVVLYDRMASFGNRDKRGQ